MKPDYMFYQIELFPVSLLDPKERTRRPSWGELIMISNDNLPTRDAAAEFCNQLWIGSNARIFIVGYGENSARPLTAWEVTRPRFDTVVNRGFSIRRDELK